MADVMPITRERDAEPLAWPAPRRARLEPLLVPALGLALALLFVGLNLLRARALALPGGATDIVIEACSRWLLYAALAPAAGALVARLPLARGHGGRRLLLHIFAMAALALLHNVLVACLYSVLHVYPRGSTLAEAVGRLFMSYFGVNFVVFWAIDGAYHALRYHHEVRVREQLAAELRARLSQAQLETLRAQLNPHFLFNTLNAVSSLALSGEREQVVRTLSVLGDLLRVSLDRDLPQEIPLERELEILRAYLEIQQVRFGDRVDFRLEVAPEVRAALLPSMILQPLVENAIEHGITVRPGAGRVVVRAARSGGQLCVHVEDTGPGFAAGGSPARAHGIGLANTRARLAQLYGDAHSLECTNVPGAGAVVELRLPLRTTDTPNGATADEGHAWPSGASSPSGAEGVNRAGGEA